MKKESHKKIYLSPQATVVVIHYDTLLLDGSGLRVENHASSGTTQYDYDVGW